MKARVRTPGVTPTGSRESAALEVGDPEPVARRPAGRLAGVRTGRAADAHRRAAPALERGDYLREVTSEAAGAERGRARDHRLALGQRSGLLALGGLAPRRR